jgi:hypothetical protein
VGLFGLVLSSVSHGGPRRPAANGAQFVTERRQPSGRWVDHFEKTLGGSRRTATLNPNRVPLGLRSRTLYKVPAAANSRRPVSAIGPAGAESALREVLGRAEISSAPFA